MYTKEDIIVMLKSYIKNTRTVKQLEYELSQIDTLITEQDTIYSMTVSPPDGESVSTGRISDKTYAAAVGYYWETQSAREQHRTPIYRQLLSLTVELRRLEHYVSLLDSDLRETVTHLYFEGMSLEALAVSLELTPKTINTRRNKAAQQLAEMYNVLDDLIER